MKGERSGLFIQAINIVRRMRTATDGKYPRFFVWENVPGAFSSNKGMDFRTVLEYITETEIPIPKGGRWANAGMVEWNGGACAWRVLDAQYWGVPQRRKRIFLVADFGGQSAGEILFERQGLRGGSSESGEAREGTPAGTESGAHGSSGDCLTPWDCQAKRIYKQDGVFPCLQSTESNGEKPGSVYVPVKARSLTERNDGSPCIDRGPELIATFSVDSIANYKEASQATTLRASGGDIWGGSENLVVVQKKTIRRLTPLECERLQGLPDYFTLIDDRTCSDTARYKALGNGMAAPCANYVIRRIREAIA